MFNDNQFEKEKTKYRRLLMGSCRLLDAKLEKNGTYEFVAPNGAAAMVRIY